MKILRHEICKEYYELLSFQKLGSQLKKCRRQIFSEIFQFLEKNEVSVQPPHVFRCETQKLYYNRKYNKKMGVRPPAPFIFPQVKLEIKILFFILGDSYPPIENVINRSTFWGNEVHEGRVSKGSPCIRHVARGQELEKEDHQHKERKSDSMDPYAGQSSVVLCAGLQLL